MKRTAWILPFLCSALLLLPLACDKDLSDPGGPEEETFQAFLNRLSSEYSTMDSTGYAKLLDSAYAFEPLPDEIDPGDPKPEIDREEELAIAGTMFHARYGAGGSKVNGIDLDLALKSEPVIDDTPYEGKPAGDTWYQVTVFVDLTVISEDPNATDGSGIINYIVNSDQVFVVRRDPGGSGRFLIVRQIDQEPINKGRRDGSTTESESWTGIKNLFRPAPESFEGFAANFAREYSERDSVAYEERLDAGYVFELLADEVDPGDSNSGWWDRAEEIGIAGRMFAGRYNPDGIKVYNVDLGLVLKSDPVVDNTPYEGKPAGETWYRATTFVDLVVSTENPAAPDGGGILHYLVNGDQIFVLRRDPGGSGRYLVVRQIDQDPIGKTGGGPNATERASWSGVKSLFRL